MTDGIIKKIARVRQELWGIPTPMKAEAVAKNPRTITIKRIIANNWEPFLHQDIIKKPVSNVPGFRFDHTK